MACVTCQPFIQLESAFDILSETSFSIIAPWLVDLLFFAFSMVFILEMIKALTNNSPNLQMLTIKFVVMAFAAAFLDFASWIPLGTFQFLSEIGPYFGQMLIETVGQYQSDYGGISGLLDAAEGSVFGRIAEAAVTLMGNVGITSKLSKWAGTVLLSIVYGVLAYQMIRGVVKAYFVIQTNRILLPFLIFFWSIDEFRIYAINGFRESIVAAFEFILGSVSIVVVLILMENVSQLDIIAGPNAADTVANFVAWQADFFAIIGAGLLMIFAHSVLMEQGGKIMLSFGQNAKGHFGGLIGTVMRAFGR